MKKKNMMWMKMIRPKPNHGIYPKNTSGNICLVILKIRVPVGILVQSQMSECMAQQNVHTSIAQISRTLQIRCAFIYCSNDNLNLNLFHMIDLEG